MEHDAIGRDVVPHVSHTQSMRGPAASYNHIFLFAFRFVDCDGEVHDSNTRDQAAEGLYSCA